ncbi:hypothetical protein K7H99_21790 (plasmid) [Providencia rettgeri]|uniref:hypothetical protein n=1 Tax=Providencia rettgeri TaxID=587 RepID=UPI001CA65553|nr:hypothetical protein [Providencia rettgeri]QZY66705.1 hypothetical protein K7H99_21790 [Providencia rettgeri]
MIIKCIENNIARISAEKIGLSENKDTDYSFLKLEEEYPVYGVYHTSEQVHFLIDIDDCKPTWVPSFLFTIIENSIPNNWSFNMIKENNNYCDLYSYFGIISMIGYYDLVTNYQHYIGILERTPSELKIFSIIKSSVIR